MVSLLELSEKAELRVFLFLQGMKRPCYPQGPQAYAVDMWSGRPPA